MQPVDSHKRERSELDYMIENSKCKIANTNKTKVNDFQCQVYYRDQIFDFQLSNIFTTTCHAVLFFCPYDFSQQSRDDLLQIEENYTKFIECGAIPIVITHDRAQIHWAYATPGKTSESLPYKPSFILASDGVDKLISTSFRAINMKTLEMIRSVVVIDNTFNVIFTHRVPDSRFFPINGILACFQ